VQRRLKRANKLPTLSSPSHPSPTILSRLLSPLLLLLLGGGLGSWLSGGFGFDLSGGLGFNLGGRGLLGGGFLSRCGFGGSRGLSRGCGLGSCLRGGLCGGLGWGLGSSLRNGTLGGGLGRGLGSLAFGLGGLGGLLVLSCALGSLLLVVDLLCGVAAGRLAALGDDGLAALLGLKVALLKEAGVVGSVLAGLVDLDGAFEVLTLLVVDPVGGDEALDFDGLVTFDCLAVLLLWLDLLFVGVGILADIILLAQVEELPDLAGSLGTKTTGNVLVCNTGQLSISLLDDNQHEGRQIGTDDATTNGLPLALSITSGPETSVTLAQQEAHTSLDEDTLHHGETLFVISTSDFEDVAFEFITQRVSNHLLGNALVIENAQFLLIFYVDTFARTRGWVGYD